MERITYRITLDAHRNGIQRTIQGFETADGMARRVAINLVAGGDTFELPMTNVVALMYVTTPTATTPSINECVIEGNTIIYDVEQIVEEGITEMQLKLIETSVDGASRVLISPRFAVEVTKSNTNDETAIQSTQFTALENALAKAEAVYNSRVTKIEILEDFTFMVYYADGSFYSSDILKITLSDGNVKMSKSWAVGGEGIRNGEDTDNSKYYSILSEASSLEASNKRDEVKALTDEARMYSAYTVFDVDFESGNLVYNSSNYEFDVDENTGNLEVNKGENYTPEKIIGNIVNEFIDMKSQNMDKQLQDIETALQETTNQAQSNKKNIETNENGIKANKESIEKINIENLENWSPEIKYYNGDVEIGTTVKTTRFNCTKHCNQVHLDGLILFKTYQLLDTISFELPVSPIGMSFGDYTNSRFLTGIMNSNIVVMRKNENEEIGFESVNVSNGASYYDIAVSEDEKYNCYLKLGNIKHIYGISFSLNYWAEEIPVIEE